MSEYISIQYKIGGQSEVGELVIVANMHAIIGLYPYSHKYFQMAQNENKCAANNLLLEAQKQLEEYFASRRQVFLVPLAPQGTPFQQRIWQELQNVTHGTTSTYGAIANSINNPKAQRAVGTAISRNPISIIIPCHRVIGGNGNLTGYAGGLVMKQWLLNHELNPKPF